jgi:galactose-6-phosphate isomerase
VPLLDVTDILGDPDLADTFWVRSRAEFIGDNGRRVVIAGDDADSPSGPSDTMAMGVVAAGPDNSLERERDQQHSLKALTIITTHRLQGPSEGRDADLVYWGQEWFVVTKVEDYSRWGAGFIQAEARATDLVDQPPLGAA